jgi:hypothetical protein
MAMIDNCLQFGRAKLRDKQRKTSASAMIGANRLATLSALSFLMGLCAGLVAFLSFQGAAAIHQVAH